MPCRGDRNRYARAVIDFTNGTLFKLAHCDPAEVAPQISALLLDGEQILVAAKTIRDFVSSPTSASSP